MVSVASTSIGMVLPVSVFTIRRDDASVFCCSQQRSRSEAESQPKPTVAALTSGSGSRLNGLGSSALEPAAMIIETISVLPNPIRSRRMDS